VRVVMSVMTIRATNGIKVIGSRLVILPFLGWIVDIFLFI
jgi:hypothetical protein